VSAYAVSRRFASETWTTLVRETLRLSSAAFVDLPGIAPLGAQFQFCSASSATAPDSARIIRKRSPYSRCRSRVMACKTSGSSSTVKIAGLAISVADPFKLLVLIQ